MTTDTFPKARPATVKIGGRRRHQRHRQGRRHDRARHGDDALLRLHRRADRRARPAGAAVEGRRRQVQRRHRRQRHLDLRHAAAVRHRQGRRARRARDHRGQRCPPGRFKRALDALLLDWPLRWCATARARASSRSPRCWRRLGASAKRIALVDRQFAAGQDGGAGEDANWGRVVMAVGKAGEPADRDRLSISFGDNRSPRGRARPLFERRPRPT
jgi:hypothetical protein